MPRPSKHVSPDTLGGRIRAAREYLHLSLAEVAGGRYSTSLISQIERNRVDPSHESLRFLATRLDLPLEDLDLLAQQHRETEVEASEYKSYEDIRNEAAQHLTNKDVPKALDLLTDLHFSQVPVLQRWRLAALRGQCYYTLRKFLKAQQDFVYALQELPKPEWISVDQQGEQMLLHLDLAHTYRQLQLPCEAQEHYTITLSMMNQDTPFGFVAEAHWGMSLITFTQARRISQDRERIDSSQRNQLLLMALEHAENARVLYRSIGQHLRAASVTCQIAEIDRVLNNTEKVCGYLRDLLSTWSHALNEPEGTDKKRHQDELCVVAASACTLAEIELERENYEEALTYAHCSLQAAQGSYKIRQAEAYTIYGRILTAINPEDPRVEEAFRKAVEVLADTERVGAKIRAHVLLSQHLLKIGKTVESEQVMERVSLLSYLVSARSSSAFLEDVPR
ncbi:MAG: helix-turn-helix transcriptional regulator [Ktedonobacteraceae bacterium]|nr:helix-turn-helix transcriptional regulator [Ktedonobacteraceae bacterium]